MKYLEKKNLANCLESLESLFQYVNNWNALSSAFRIDGVKKISPANPSQWIFVKINNFDKSSYQGKEASGNSCTGEDWNGVYYLAGGTRVEALKYFLASYKKHKGDPNKIFSLRYTSGREGNPNKRRIELAEYSGDGWMCLKYRNMA